MNDMDVSRFMRYVEKTDSCWLWTGAKIPRGYGRFYFKGKVCYAHRVALMLLAGEEVPDDRLVMHTCDNSSCVNPEHLLVATQTDNMQDAAAKGRTVNSSDWRGHRNPKAKLSVEQMALLQQRIASGVRTGLIVSEFGVTRARVQQIAKAMRAKKDGGGWDVERFE